MSEPLLLTKLYIPPPRPKVVLHPRLVERLNEGLSSSRKLTLISAPAGFGKTTLVSEWMSSYGRPVAWLSLDEGDNNPSCFLAYLVTALQTITPKIGADVLAALQSPQPPSAISLLTALHNEIVTLPDNFILVLDDYHVIDSAPVDQALAFLLEHLPLQMHLVISTREDPPLPLARLRARGQLTELRASDLRFTPAEAAEFLNRIMGLDLSPENISALETRTKDGIPPPIPGCHCVVLRLPLVEPSLRILRRPSHLLLAGNRKRLPRRSSNWQEVPRRSAQSRGGSRHYTGSRRKTIIWRTICTKCFQPIQ
jgi:LuxR family maltose regulon positive regulatory protein